MDMKGEGDNGAQKIMFCSLILPIKDKTLQNVWTYHRFNLYLLIVGKPLKVFSHEMNIFLKVYNKK
jgi:hypothetical protein